MWPWEHAAFGYVCYSLGSHLLRGRPPRGGPTLVLAVATQLPDLVDKPLSWGLEWFPRGYAIGHSVFLAVPLAALVLYEGRRRGRLAVAVAFVVGYWSHLLGDVLNPLRDGEAVEVGRVLWPVVEGDPYAVDLGLRRGINYLGRYVSTVGESGLSTILLVHLGPILVTLALWLVDGAPGFDLLVRRVKRPMLAGSEK